MLSILSNLWKFGKKYKAKSFKILENRYTIILFQLNLKLGAKHAHDGGKRACLAQSGDPRNRL